MTITSMSSIPLWAIVEDGHRTETGTELIGVYGTYEKALKMQKYLESVNQQPDYKYTGFHIQENLIL